MRSAVRYLGGVLGLVLLMAGLIPLLQGLASEPSVSEAYAPLACFLIALGTGCGLGAWHFSGAGEAPACSADAAASEDGVPHSGEDAPTA